MEMKWKKLTEESPPIDEEFLYWDGTDVGIGLWNGTEVWSEAAGPSGPVTHWMPLPKPPPDD